MPGPGDGDTTGGMSLGGEVTGTVRAGRFVLKVGSPAGTLVFLSPGEASDSRFRRSSGSVFDGRTLKCQSS